MTQNEKPKFFYGWIIVIAGFLIQIVIGGTMYSFGVFFKPILTEFGWTRAMTAGAFSLFVFLHGFFYIVTGRLNDRFGPRLVLTAGGFFLGLGYLLMSQISATWQIYLFYGLIIAIGAGSGFVPLVSTISRWFTERRGLATGIVCSGVGVGTMIMPPIANQLISVHGWRTSYIIFGIIALVLIMAAAQFLRHEPRQMGLLPYGEGEIKEGGVNLEARGFPFREAINTRQFWMLGSALLCFGICQQVIMVHITPHAIDLRISTTSAANILAIIGGIGVIARIMMGGTADRIGNRSAVAIGLILFAIAFFWLLTARELWTLYLFAIIFGFGYGAIGALISPLVADMFGLSSHGVILGTIIFITTIGGAIGPVTAGRMFDTTNSYNLAFLICAVISVIGVILILLLRPTTGKGGTNDSKRSARLY